jgi:hypothetical protein
MPYDRPLPLSVLMISRDEAHNIAAVASNLRGFAAEVFLVDSYSTDNTVDLALAHGINVVQRRFRDFGDQWNFAVVGLPVTQPWSMKLDPDERLTDALKEQIAQALQVGAADAFSFPRRLWFMGRPLPVRQDVLRIWRTGTCRFTDSKVNEHPVVPGRHRRLTAELQHHDSPNLHHWYDKQNRYSTAEANVAVTGKGRTATPRLCGSKLERRAALKRAYDYLPAKHLLMTLYCLLVLGAWRGGRAGLIWAQMRGDVFRMRALKRLEMRWQGAAYDVPPRPRGAPHPGVPQFDADS